jgi:polyvinyl alcohol dehydrogenase (cytochrome)
LLKRIAAAAVVIAAAGVGATAAPSAAATPDCSWPQYGHDAAHSFSQSGPCTFIKKSNVATLVPRWFVPTADSVTASPAISNGTVYVGSWDGIMSALDQKTGKEHWRFNIADVSRTAFGRIESSAAVVTVDGRRLVIFGGGATLYALDALNGREVASICLDPTPQQCRGGPHTAEIESSPAAVTIDGAVNVFVGMDVHNDENAGHPGVVRVRVDHTGDTWSLVQTWKFEPESRLTGGDTLTGCADVWSSPAVDLDNGLVFFGTGSCDTPGITIGESMWAVRLSDGAFVWTFDAHRPDRFPARDWDDDFGASPNLLPPTNEAPAGLVGEGNKDGTYYALNRLTGEQVWATHAGEAGHVTSGFAVGGMIGSAATGFVHGEPAIFATTAISTPINAPIDQKFGDVDASLLKDPGRLFSIHAIRARDGKLLWRSPLSRASYGAASYANGVVFVPSTFDFSIKALDADTGLLRWESPVIGAPSATPVTVGNALITGAGTRTTDVEYKTFGAGALDGLAGPSPLAPLSGVWGFKLLLRHS